MPKQELDKPEIKAVIFDLGNVILSFDNLKISGFIARKSGASQDAVHGFVFGTELENAIDRGQITLKDFLGKINERFSSGISIEEFTPVWRGVFTQNAGIEEVIRGLKSKNYRLGILSNTNKPHFEFVKSKFPVLGLFDDYHLSYETGYLKPEKQAFENVIAFYRCQPQSLVFTDDIEANIAAAKRLGINALRFKSSAQLGSDLSNIGLLY
jgi:glucose-1-phosphatase